MKSPARAALAAALCLFGPPIAAQLIPGSTPLPLGPMGGSGSAVAVDPADAQNVLLIKYTQGLFRSADGGITWAPYGSGISANARELVPDPANGQVLYSLDGNQVMKSTDFGAIWSPLGLVAIENLKGVSIASSGGGLLASDAFNVYHSPDGGTSWLQLAFMEIYVRETALTAPGGTRLIGLSGGVYAAPQGQPLEPTDWTFDLGSHTEAIAVSPLNPDLWVTGGVGSFFDNAQIVVLFQGGTQIYKTYERFGAGRVEDIEFDPFDGLRLLAGLYPAGFGSAALILSTDSGASWIEIAGTQGWSTRSVAFDPLRPGRVLQLSDNNQWSQSDDGGSTWLPLQPAWPGSYRAIQVIYDPFEVGVIYRGEEGSGLWRSDDDGATWTALGIPMHQDSDIELHPQIPGLLWVSDASGRLLISGDRGDNFDPLWTAPQGASPSALALDTADGSMLAGTTAASAWELPRVSPFVVFGDGTAGTGGSVPRHWAAGGLPRIGNASFALGGDRVLGGALAFQAYGVGEAAYPLFGGSLYIGLPVGVIGAQAGGTPGVGGAGEFAVALPIPSNPNLVGHELVSQFIALDAGAAHIDGVVLSNALRTSILP